MRWLLVRLTMLSIMSRTRVNSWSTTRGAQRFQSWMANPEKRQAATPYRHLTRSHATATDDTPQDILYKELKSLSLEIQRHDNLYYNGEAEPILSDGEYDALVRREAEICQEQPEILKKLEQEGIQTRFGGRVGTPTVTTDRVKKAHLVPMLSLDNIHTEEELNQWFQRIQKQLPDATELRMITEPKLDGLSLSIRYAEDGAFLWAATRGDGKEGQDVSNAVRDMQSIPLQIKPTGAQVEIRGEVVLPTSVFKAMQGNETAGNLPFSNARNAASGIILRKANNDLVRKDLRFYAYDAVGFDATDGQGLRSILTSIDFQVPEPHAESVVRLNENETIGSDPMLNYLNELSNHKLGRASNLTFADYDMDGAVHKVSSFAVRSLVGSSNRSPRWAVAHKFESQTTITKLLGVEVQVGRTGALTPVAQLESVDIQGVNVSRATLHNFVHLQQMMGAKKVPVGTPVLVRRAGEVIPQVVQRLELDIAGAEVDYVSLEAPTHCPACASKTVWAESANKTTGQILRCGGPALGCPPRATSAIAHAFSRDAFDITGLSEARIQQLMDEDIMKVPSDLFQLASSNPISESLVANISDMPGWGSKSVKNLQATIDRVSKEGISLGRFIYSLGIRFAGKHTSNLLAEIYGTVDKFLDDIEEAKTANTTESFSTLQEETEENKGVGPVLIASLQAFAKDATMVEAAQGLAKVVPVKPKERREASTTAEDEQMPWRGLSVVFTGSLPGISRSAAQKLAMDVLGAKSTSTAVSKSTSLVIIGEKAGKKQAQAANLDVPTMDAADFVKLVEKTMGT